LDIPRDRLVVITGPSGSGKSSLAFDTLYAEGQRQYIESLSIYARQFLPQLQRPDVDLVDGLEPTISIDQRPGVSNRRSTVATATEIYDFLRVLMARRGEATCYGCGASIRQQTPEQIQEQLMQLPEGTWIMILAAMVRGRKGAHRDVFARIRKARLVRARVDGIVYDMDQMPPLAPRRTHHIEAVVDRIVIREGAGSRIGDAVRLAAQEGEGVVIVCYQLDTSSTAQDPEGWHEQLFSTRYACATCNISYEELEPRTFSFNSPYGACPVCDGLGVRPEFDPELVIPDPSRSLAEGGIAPWKGTLWKTEHAQTTTQLARWGLHEDVPLVRLEPPVMHKLLYGDDRQYPGVLMMLEKEYATTTSRKRLAQLESFRSDLACQACGGSRLRREAIHVKFAGKAIHEITALSVEEAYRFFAQFPLAPPVDPVAAPLVLEISKRLDFLRKVGIQYLALDRPTDTLSGGELQRVRLATGIGSGLVGVCYLLDEPSIGLHPRDSRRLIDALRELQELGNTVLVVEHDEAFMRAADLIIDMGPGAGARGGSVVAQGTPASVLAHPTSLTGHYLARKLQIAVPARRRRVAKTRSVVIEGVSTNNLKNITVRFPLGTLVCVTGVSGSGKSSLVNETLAPALIRRLGGIAPKPGPHKSLRGVRHLDQVVRIDQSPIGRTPRSNPATYSGVFDEVRRVFAGTREAKQRGFGVSRFSFNNKEGRCESCQGQGVQKIQMTFLPDLYVTCDQCHGARFNRQTLLVRYRGQTIAQVLEMSVDQAAVFFENFSSIARVLESLQRVGLGYLPLGQPSTALSGGEAQRIKLGTELARTDTGRTVYLLDEPTTGLHFSDIQRLLDVLQRLVDKANTVIVIEHNLEVIKSADWIIDLGPDGGEAGGYLLAAGTPEHIAALEDNQTGRFLRAHLKEPIGKT
jgi:excinuclease ABC subunit A